MKRTAREARGKFRIAAASAKYQKPREWNDIDDMDASWDAHKY
jgi:hypothetical protein